MICGLVMKNAGAWGQAEQLARLHAVEDELFEVLVSTCVELLKPHA